MSWTWDEFLALPSETVTVDIHCVTKWSKLDTVWTGVSLDTLLDGVETSAEYVIACSDGGYTTNLPLEDLTGGKAWIAFAYDGEPLEPEHGGPARLLVPHLYFWKSAKWVRGLELRDDDEPGFWEGYGYHNYGDPWREQRYCGRLNWQLARSSSSSTRRRGQEHRARRARVARSPGGPTRRRPADRRGRLPGAAQLLDRIGARGRAPRPHGRAARRRRGLAVPDRRAPSGDELELRGPIGGYFVWEAARAGRCCCSRGGSGIVPLRAMLRHRAAIASDRPGAAALFGAGRLAEVIYRDELARPCRRGVGLHMPDAHPRAGRRTGAAIGAGSTTSSSTRSPGGRTSDRSSTSVARPGFVEAAASGLVALGHEQGRIRTDRFGSTGVQAEDVTPKARTLMEALDGNAIAGLLFDVFGAEMTTATGVCASCGAGGPVAEVDVSSSCARNGRRCRAAPAC